MKITPETKIIIKALIQYSVVGAVVTVAAIGPALYLICQVHKSEPVCFHRGALAFVFLLCLYWLKATRVLDAIANWSAKCHGIKL